MKLCRMFGTFLSPDTCGFAKIAALEIEKEVKNAVKGNCASSSENTTKPKQSSSTSSSMLTSIIVKVARIDLK